MKIVFQTNLDKYDISNFPRNLTHIPRIGETVLVRESMISYYTQKSLPPRLKVVDVIHTELGVICELWYKESDINRMKQQNVNPY